MTAADTRIILLVVVGRARMVASNKKPQADFVVRLVGPGVRPWAVPMRSLARVLKAVQRLVDQRDEESEDYNESKEEIKAEINPLHLVGIISRSAGYAVSAPDRQTAVSRLSVVGEAIEDPVRSDWPSMTLLSVKELSEVARSMGCEIEFREQAAGKPYGGVIARITPRTYSDISSSAFIRGETSVYAKIERVGGAVDRHCGIRLPDSPRKMVICGVSSVDLVRKLGKHLYQHVMLHGQATWLRHNWTLRRVLIRSFDPPKTGSIMKALKDAHDAGGHVWDKIEDPDAIIAEMRGQ